MTSSSQLAILALSIFVGVLFPSLASLFAPLLLPTIFLLFLFAIYQVQFRDVLRVVVNDRLVWLVIGWQLFVLPLLATVLLKPLLSGQWYLFTLVALSTSAITATTALARIFSLNDALALSVCIIGTIIMPLPLYLVLNLAVGIDAQIQLVVYAERIIIFILLPFVVVWLLRRVLALSIQEKLVAHTPSIVLCLLMFFGLSVMDGVRDMMHENPYELLLLVLLAYGISLVTQGITWISLRSIGECDVKTLCLLCSYRNMGIVAAIAGPVLGEKFLIFIGVWQLPMYTLPLLLRAFYQLKKPVSNGG